MRKGIFNFEEKISELVIKFICPPVNLAIMNLFPVQSNRFNYKSKKWKYKLRIDMYFTSMTLIHAMKTYFLTCIEHSRYSRFLLLQNEVISSQEDETTNENASSTDSPTYSLFYDVGLPHDSQREKQNTWQMMHLMTLISN